MVFNIYKTGISVFNIRCEETKSGYTQCDENGNFLCVPIAFNKMKQQFKGKMIYMESLDKYYVFCYNKEKCKTP
jgi:hypothetical protein